MRRLLACVLVVALTGCIQLQQYDPMTVEQIEKTIDFEKTDFSLSAKALVEHGAPPVVLNSLELRHEAELARLRAWLLAELAKRTEDNK